MKEEYVSQTVDPGRRKALVRLGTYSALAAPAMMTLLAEPSAAKNWNGSGGGNGKGKRKGKGNGGRGRGRRR